MIVSRADLIAVLRQFNPWWKGERMADLPTWRRAAFAESATVGGEIATRSSCDAIERCETDSRTMPALILRR